MNISAAPLTPEAFAGFGDVIALPDAPGTLINDGLCQRFSDLARLDIVSGRAGVSLFASELRALPYECDLLERHPLGSQCFLPMGGSAYLAVVARSLDAGTAGVQAFIAGPDQGVNIARGVWHGVLCPISGSGLFAVIDRIGEGANLEEHRLKTPIRIEGRIPDRAP